MIRETGLDEVRDVGLRGDSIVRISRDPLEGLRTIDVGGLVVAPEFIDLHRHGHTLDGYVLMALDGVTTALELELGVPDLQKFIEGRQGKSLINFGAAASHLAARVLAFDAPLTPSLFGPAAAAAVPASGPVTDDPASRE